MFRTSFATVAIAAFGTLGATAASAQAAAGSLIPHRAVYDLQLKDASERSGISGMYGRMVYEFLGSECAGYTTNFRFVTSIDTGEDTRLTDQQTTTFEDLKGGKFRFETKTFTDEQLDKQVSGAAEDEEDKLKVELNQPDKREVELADGRFPTAHMLDVIENARKGPTFFEARVFDGSDNGDKTLLTTTVVGKQDTPKADDADAAKAGEFAKSPFWPVTIAYFNDTSTGDSLPIYRMSFKLYENGITRDLTMDYGDFVLTGRLSKLELLGPGECH
ncbi:DUF1849 domain-containing protein [Metarhizobium album]|uniref:DUF1849 domain-containing protein n=1 Tax=Metarhizobium album TaxID=2182425 RepID=A0A2U2DPY5_9HYPH|nr:cell envelope integrity EipB family protein [Rhizobium album]PWE55363.1 DUF1849 domain-containing protein [Rhizobium album]